MRLGVALRAWAASTGSAVTHARDSDMCNEPHVNALRYRDIVFRALCNRPHRDGAERRRRPGRNARPRVDRPPPNRPIKDPYVLTYCVDTACASALPCRSYTEHTPRVGERGTSARGVETDERACAIIVLAADRGFGRFSRLLRGDTLIHIDVCPHTDLTVVAAAVDVSSIACV